MYCEYWNKLNALGIYARKYSWKFDREFFCDRLFVRKAKKRIERSNFYEIPLKDGFLPRFINRGFSDQADVPNDLHDKVIAELLQSFKENYGQDFTDISLKGSEKDIFITIFIK